jgi:hypothetical protein
VHPAGAVGVIVRAPRDRTHSYRVRFADGFEAALHHDNLMLLAEYKQGAINDFNQVLTKHGLFHRVIYRCVIGSRAYGLATDESDTDRRGIYLPPADLQWSLYGPEKGRLDAADVELHEREYQRLVADLETVPLHSVLPETPRGRDALNALLLRLRLRTKRP